MTAQIIPFPRREPAPQSVQQWTPTKAAMAEWQRERWGWIEQTKEKTA